MITIIHHAWSWFEHATGMTNGSGAEYLFWSGIGSDLTEFLVLGGLIGLFRKHNCVVKGCWRVGRRPTAAGDIVCHRHHPGGKPSHLDVIKAHKEALK